MRTLPWMIAVTLGVTLACARTPTGPSEPMFGPAPVEPPPPPPPPPPEPVVPRLQFTSFLAFGDSLTEGQATPLFGGTTNLLTPCGGAVLLDCVERSYPFKLLARLSARYTKQTVLVYNGAIGGRQAKQDVDEQRLVALIDQVHPEVVILMEGVNDLNAGFSISATIGNIQTLVDQALARSVRVLLSTIPIENENGTKGRLTSGVLTVPFNTALKTQIRGATLVDIYPVVTLDMVGPDGLHLLQSGNQALADTYFATIQQMYEVPTTTVEPAKR